MSVQSSRITSLLLLSLLFGGVMAVRQVLASEKPDLQVQVSLVSSDTFSWGSRSCSSMKYETLLPNLPPLTWGKIKEAG